MKTESYNNAREALRVLSNQLVRLVENKTGDVFNLALSGGETAKQMFTLWTNEYRDKINWGMIRFYWVDERCVPETDDESNYGHANELLFKPLDIPKSHIRRIKGENDPQSEASRYSDEVMKAVPVYNGLPRFDCIILGVGDDAHTASIFPTTMDLLEAPCPYAVSRHPQTGQYRVTMTGPLILNCVPLLVPVLGSGKAEVVARLQAGYQTDAPAPAPYILSHAVDATLYISE